MADQTARMWADGVLLAYWQGSGSAGFEFHKGHHSVVGRIYSPYTLQRVEIAMYYCEYVLMLALNEYSHRLAKTIVRIRMGTRRGGPSGTVSSNQPPRVCPPPFRPFQSYT